jgi:hypothetical protein
MVAAALLMAAILWFASGFVMPYTQGSGIQRLLALGLLVGGGVAAYFGAGLVLGAYDPRQLISAFRRGTA